MRTSSKLVQNGLIALVAVLSLTAQAAPKEWTMLVFINGNNNLDKFGAANLKLMETVGSNDNVNIVAQWASMSQKTTKRMLVQKSTDKSKVTSPVVQELPRVDMGDYQNLIEFVRWGVANYPAKHYFLEMWNHGMGWHRNHGGILKPLDISFDELTNHVMTTPQFGQALAESAKIMGHKIDLVASDACLMSMAEVAYEIADSVDIYAGSEEVEPGAGWPYDKILSHWMLNPMSSAVEVGKIIAEEYTKSYAGQMFGDVTYSVFDLSKIDAVVAAAKAVANSLAKLSPSEARAMASVAATSLTFQTDESDYIDFGDFMNKVETARTGAIPVDILASARSAISGLVVGMKNSSHYANASGLSVWVPPDSYTYDKFATKYAALKFEKETNWSQAVKNLATNSSQN